MKTLIVTSLIALLALTGCTSKSHSETSMSYDLPAEMKDCKVFELSPEGMGNPVITVYCPGKTTVSETRSMGKTLQNVVVVTDPATSSSASNSDSTQHIFYRPDGSTVTKPNKLKFYKADGTEVSIGKSSAEFSDDVIHHERIFVLANGSYLRCDPVNGKLLCDNNKQ